MNFIRFFAVLEIALGYFSSFLCGAEFRALSWEGVLQDVTYRGQAHGEKLVIYDSGLTTWQKITPGAVPVQFFRAAEHTSTRATTANSSPAAAPSTKGAAPDLLAQVVWPVGVNRALLLFVSAPTGSPTPYNIVVIPDREATAVPPAIRLFNYSIGPVAVQLDQAPTLELVPRQIHEDEELPASGKKMLKLAYRDDVGKWKIAANQNVAVPPGFVTYIFVRNIPHLGLNLDDPTVSFKLIYDRVPTYPNMAAKK